MNKSIKIYYFIFCIYLLTFIKVDSKSLIDTNDLKNRYGFFGAFENVNNNVNFTKLPGVPNCCGGFASTSGSGFLMSGILNIQLDYKKGLEFKAGYSYNSAFFNSTESIPILLNGDSAIGVSNHQLFTKFHHINLQALGTFKPLEDKRFFVKGGLDFNLLVSSYYSQKEVLVEPSDRGTFLDEKRERNYSTGSVPTATTLLVGLNLGFSYEFVMNKTNSLFLVPEISYSYYLNKAIDSSWNIGMLRAGVAIKYRTPPTPPPPPPPAMIPPYPKEIKPPLAPPVLSGIIDVSEIDSLGNEKKDAGIKIEDFVSLNMRPLLNYVFFEENSSKIPKRYKLLNSNDANKFALKDLQNCDALKTYYQVLNIIGKRLNENPENKIKIIGCNSNIREEKNNKELSRERAESVKSYFKDVWNINEDKMIIEARNLPDQESKSDTITGQEENMRVEIETFNDEIIKPVITIDTLRFMRTSKFRFRMDKESIFGIKNWEVIVTQGNRELFYNEGMGNPPEFVEWEMKKEGDKAPQGNTPVSYKFKIKDSLGVEFTSKAKSLPIEQLTVAKKRIEKQDDKQFEYYSLILFDYGKSNLGKEHKEVVDFVKDRISKEAKVYIYGYTDAKGETKINQKISEARAHSVAKRLNLKGVEVEGLGESQLLYDNSYPEGRFYCRTVRISVETDIK